MPRRLPDDARHERPGARALSELRRPIAPPDLRAEDQPVQFLESDRGEIREGFPVREIAKERELQKVYKRMWLPPPVKHSPWE
jgi:hypothetical protein